MLRCKTACLLSVLLIAASLHAATPDASAPVRIHGATVLVQSKTHATIFVVRNGDGSGPIQHLFQVWSNPGLELNATYRDADVEYTNTALVVIVPGDKAVATYNVAGHKSPVLPTPEGFATTTFEVFGINHQLGAGVEALKPPTSHAHGRIRALECTDCDWLPFEDPWGAAGGGTTCNSGGVGSTSCSISGSGGSCSVTCAAGYACCNSGNPPSCTCKY
jgi:hypothetical protein